MYKYKEYFLKRIQSLSPSDVGERGEIQKNKLQ